MNGWQPSTYLFTCSIKEHSKNKKMCSLTAKNSLPRRHPQGWDTSRILDLDSKHPNKLLNPNTSIRNAPSPAVYRSGARYWKALWFLPKCKGPLWWGGITCTMSLNTTDMKKDTGTSPYTAHPPSPWRKETSWWLDNAVPSAKPSTSMCWRSSPTKSSAMSGNNLCYSDLYIDYSLY